MEVIATGKITTFPGSSKYQIVIETLEPAGAGALMALVGSASASSAPSLFDPARKRPHPSCPRYRRRDLAHRRRHPRHPPPHLRSLPRACRRLAGEGAGRGSGEEVANAIRGFNAFEPHGPTPRPDVLIVARGGGGLEDLWSFNDEIVVRAAAENWIPLISAVFTRPTGR